MTPDPKRPGIPEGDVLVLGAGASGLAAARFLSAAGRSVTVADDRPPEAIGRAEDFRECGAGLPGRGLPTGVPDGVGLVVASPGIPPSAPVFAAAEAAGVPVWSELELGFRALGEPADRIAAVTGTKGKSSVVTLTSEALRLQGIPAAACGNLGIPLTAYAVAGSAEAASLPPGGVRDTVFVIEASSFQLSRIARFRPRAAVLLAVSGDHLDWHPDLDHYRASKARIFENQTPADWAVFDREDPVASGIAEAAAAETGAQALPLGLPRAGRAPQVVMESGVRGRVVYVAAGRVRPLARFASLRVPGEHGRRNLAAAAAAAQLFGAGQTAIEAAARSFAGMPHALEEVGMAEGVRFVNDSRATSLAATTAALEVLSEEAPPRSVALILGGILKAGSYGDLEEHLGCVAGVWAIGESRDLAVEAIRSVPATRCDSLEEAVQGAFDDLRTRFPAGAAASRGVVLLSPGCASFDQFPSYARRGRRFTQIARQLGAREFVS